MKTFERRAVSIPDGEARIEGELWLPAEPQGLVIFAHGSGSSRHSPRNRFVATELVKAGLGTLLIDLLTVEEEAAERWTRHLRFDIDLLARRLSRASEWAREDADVSALPIGYFGSSTGAAAALVAAANRPEGIAAVVSRGGRPDLAGEALPRVKAPTLLVVGSEDTVVLELNRDAYQAMRCERDLRIVPRATHLFEEPGALERVTGLAESWFRGHLHPPVEEHPAHP